MKQWVLPINIKKHDIIEHLKHHDTFVWKARRHFCKGDIVYVYITSPIQELRYACSCIDDNVSMDILEKHTYAIEPEIKRYAMFKVEKEYSEGLFPWSELHNNGLGQALLPSRVYAQLEEYICSKE